MRLNIKDIVPNPANPRVIRDEQFRKLKQSLAQFPQMLEKRPIAVTKEGGKYIALGGNQRLRALLDLQKEIDEKWFQQTYYITVIEEEILVGYFAAGIPVVDCTELTPMQQKRFIIADNVPFGEWDWEGLANEWDVEELADWGLNVPGWEPTEGEGNEVSEEELDESAEDAEEIQTDIKLGDLFEIGPHRLLCGDSTSEADVSRLMNGRKADILTDPPYGINANKQTLGTGKKQFHRGDNWDSKVPDFFYVLNSCELAIIWGGNYFANKLPITNDWLCWHKKNDGLSFSEFELAWSNTGKNCRILSHHWGGEEKLHPTMKPVKVMSWCIDFLKSDTILDPFLGSGSTMVAAQQCGRTCYGLELDPKYCQVIVNRMQKLYPSLQITKNGQPYATANTTTEGE